MSNSSLLEFESLGETDLPSLQNCTIAIIGLGYVGLPLALEFSKTKICKSTASSINRRIIGFDIDISRLQELDEGYDRTNEVTREELSLASPSLKFTSNISTLSEADVFIITVPTPIDKAKCPNLIPLRKASKTVGEAIKIRNSRPSVDNKPFTKPVVIYESTVYPGVTSHFENYLKKKN